MTDNEIIKALECCLSGEIIDCYKCPFYERCGQSEELSVYTIDLINRQKAAVEFLTEQRDRYLEDATLLSIALENQKLENERLRRSMVKAGLILQSVELKKEG